MADVIAKRERWQVNKLKKEDLNHKTSARARIFTIPRFYVARARVANFGYCLAPLVQSDVKVVGAGVRAR